MSLETHYLGLKLRNPLILGACPLSGDVDAVRRVEDAGAAAIVMHSLFEEQIRHAEVSRESSADEYTTAFSDALFSTPNGECLEYGADSYAEQVAVLKEALSIPVVGSFNGSREGTWVEYARLIEQAGADALELNLYFLPVDPEEDAASLEDRYLRIVESVRSELSIPLAVKLSPNFSALPHFVRRLCRAGVDGVVLFNRFYQPDIDLDTMEYEPRLEFSTSGDLPARLRLLAILHGRVDADLSVAGGVHSGGDLVKAVLSGAASTQVVSAVLREGPEAVARILREAEEWADKNNCDSLEQIRGSMSLEQYPQPEAIERANYLRVLKHWTRD